MTDFKILELVQDIVDSGHEFKEKEAEEIVDNFLNTLKANFENEYRQGLEEVVDTFGYICDEDFGTRMFRKLTALNKILRKISGDRLNNKEMVDYVLENVSVAYKMFKSIIDRG